MRTSARRGIPRLATSSKMIDTSVKLTVLNNPKWKTPVAIAAMSKGWPHLIASVKSHLETGYPLEETMAGRVDL